MKIKLKSNMASKSATLNRGAENSLQPDCSRASSIIMEDVRNLKGQLIGKVKDIMINIHSGKIEYLVLDVSTFLGLNSKLFAIPFSEVRRDEHTKKLLVDRSKYYLKDSPGFDKSHWPATNLHEYKEDEGSFFGLPAVTVGYQ